MEQLIPLFIVFALVMWGALTAIKHMPKHS
jgi:hypothetical protein